jgi:hypothetical protein
MAARPLLGRRVRLHILRNAESTIDDIAKPAGARYIRPLAQVVRQEAIKLGHQILIQLPAPRREDMRQDHQILIQLPAPRREDMKQCRRFLIQVPALRRATMKPDHSFLIRF